MKILPKFGIDQLIFGMKQTDVKNRFGEPDKQFEDEDKNVIWTYNQHQIRLTFYEDESLRLGYIICSSPASHISEVSIIGRKVEEIKKELEKHQIKTWAKEDFDITENHFNEENWLILASEFGRIVKIEMGAIINNNDEFDWKFK
jgi:hypothetical protein